DGSRIIFGSDRDGGLYNPYQKLANGTGDEERVLKSSDFAAPHDWSRDGRYVVLVTSTSLNARGPFGPGRAFFVGGGTIFDLSILPLFGDRKPRAFLHSDAFSQVYGQVSPDGRWIAYLSTESGRPEVFVRSF